MDIIFSELSKPVYGSDLEINFIQEQEQEKTLDLKWSQTDRHPDITLSDNDLTATAISDNARGIRSNFSFKGKKYWEVSINQITYPHNIITGIATSAESLEQYPGYTEGESWGYSSVNGLINGDVLRFALDSEAGYLWIARNDTWLAAGQPVSGLTPYYSGLPANDLFAMVTLFYTGHSVTVNFGASAFQYPCPEGFEPANRYVFETTWNPYDSSGWLSLSDNNLTAKSDLVILERGVRANRKITGKKYWEIFLDSHESNGTNIGVCTPDADFSRLRTYSYAWLYNNYGVLYHNGVSTPGYLSSGTGDIIGIAVDQPNGKIWFAKNNVWMNGGNPVTGENPAFQYLDQDIFPVVSFFSDSSSVTANFGASVMKYGAPSGFLPFDLPSVIIHTLPFSIHCHKKREIDKTVLNFFPKDDFTLGLPVIRNISDINRLTFFLNDIFYNIIPVIISPVNAVSIFIRPQPVYYKKVQEFARLILTPKDIITRTFFDKKIFNSIRTLYKCYLEYSGKDTLEIPMYSFETRLTLDTKWLNVVSPAIDLADGVTERIGAEIVIKKCMLFIKERVEISKEIVRVTMDDIGFNEYVKSGQFTLSGHQNYVAILHNSVEIDTPVTRTVSGGKRRYKCGINEYLEPGCIAEIYEDNFIVGSVTHRVNPNEMWMEITEADSSEDIQTFIKERDSRVYYSNSFPTGSIYPIGTRG